MSSSISAAFQSFWHAMTSYDRHAAHDSPYRTGQHVPLAQSRHTPLSSVVTSPFGSSHDLSPDQLEPESGYRSSAARAGHDGIPMQSLADGMAPPPPVAHSWRRIDRWLEKNYPELSDNICDGCTQNDINELEHVLDHTIPLEVRDSLMCHDGQERGGLPTGLLFGCMLLDCEEIEEEWSNWQRVGTEFFDDDLSSPATAGPSRPTFMSSASQYSPSGGLEAGPSSASVASPSSATSSNGSARSGRASILARQRSLPEGAVQCRYTSPHWIPLARDWGGNCLGVDLDPGPTGRFGQVILFGRDFDTKVVVSRSWAAFLATIADDFDTGKAQIVADFDDLANAGSGAAGIGEGTGPGHLWLREFAPGPKRMAAGENGPIVPFMQILRVRAENRFGKRRSQGPRTRARPARSDGFRPSSKSASKRPMPTASPLSRVMEEPNPVVPVLSSGSSGSASSSRSSGLHARALAAVDGNSRTGGTGSDGASSSSSARGKTVDLAGRLSSQNGKSTVTIVSAVPTAGSGPGKSASVTTDPTAESFELVDKEN